MSEELENWACMELDKLGLPDAGVIVQYLGPLEEPKEVENYLSSMLDITNKSHREFIRDFVERQAESKVDKRFYRKKDEIEEQHVGRPQGKKKGKDKGRSTTSSGSVSSNERNRNNNPNTASGESNGNDDKENISTSEPQQKGKKKKKYVNLYTEDDVVMLSGRNVCECLASKHNLINNCLSCGRIVCEQEGAGPCFFCGNIVKTKADVEVQGPQPSSPVEKKNIKGKKLSVKDIASDMKKAVEHKNKLLEYDRTSEKRTKVLDDECDYFNSNSKWISKEDREILQAREDELRAKKYDRSNQRITIDLLGRQVMNEDVNEGIFDPEDPVVKAILEKQQNDIFTDHHKLNLPPPSSLVKPVYMSEKSDDKNFSVNSLAMSTPGEVANHMNRLQDKELQEIADQGKCLSMHQPWASLLIAGIKMHEGRTWYSSHRGRLWIASAAKVPTIKDIESLENSYSMFAPDEAPVTFPKHYPPGCLLGSVDVVDVLPQEEYRVKYPDGESDSPFVFICERPREMIFKFPLKGEHKIFCLDSKIHQAAKKALK